MLTSRLSGAGSSCCHRWHSRTFSVADRSRVGAAARVCHVPSFNIRDRHGRWVPASATPVECSWASSISEAPEFMAALEQSVEAALNAPSSCSNPDLAVVFISSAFVRHYDRVVEEVRKLVPSLKTIVGSTGYGVIGTGTAGPREVESAPAFSITLAALPNTQVSLAHVSPGNLPDGDAPPAAWQQLLGPPTGAEANTSFVVLAEPTFARLVELLAGLDFAYPEASVLGGLSSAGMMSESRALFAWSEASGLTGMLRTGALVLGLHGDVALELLIAQGCRPLSSSTWQVEQTAAPVSQKILAMSKLGSKSTLPPIMALQEEFKAISVASRQELDGLLRNMTCGLAPPGLPGQVSEPQDFLIRQIGFDNGGNLVVGDMVKPGQQLKFMVRDRRGAREDLESHGLAFKRRQLAALMEADAAAAPPVGMMLFSCNGRGMGLYNEPDFDSKTISQYVPVPCTGFLCNGEIGKVAGSTRLHGFTCAVGVLRLAPKKKASGAEGSAAVAQEGPAGEAEQQ